MGGLLVCPDELLLIGRYQVTVSGWPARGQNFYAGAQIDTAVLISTPPPAPTLEVVRAVESMTCALLIGGKFQIIPNQMKVPC